jgi:Protein of unknown function (DUF4038)/Putative collagen-binding domain of a collagenase
MAARVAFFTILAAIIYGVPEDVPPAQARSTTATVKAEAAAAQRFAAPPLFPVRISGRHLVDKTGVPFMVVGDSPQAIINIPLTGAASVASYFFDRHAHGFNSAWINLICDSYTACPTNGATYDGIVPFTGLLRGCTGGAPVCYDLTTENPVYFSRIDAIINKAASYGILVFLDPISTDGCTKANWMQTLINNGAERAANYGAYIGNRYKRLPNIVWMSGNDFQCSKMAPDDNLAADVVRGIEAAGDKHLQTSELNYNYSTAKDDTGALGSLVTLNAAYTYYPTYDEVLHGYNQSTLPIFMEESNYEFENNCCEPGKGIPPTMPVSQEVLRKQEYWTMLSGAAGQLYGNHYTWTFTSGWDIHLDTLGVAYLGYMRRLFLSVPWYNLVPDQNHHVMTSGYGSYTRNGTGDITHNSYATTALAATSTGTVVVAYIPGMRTVTIDMTQLGSNIRAQWYDPTAGTYTTIAGSPFGNVGPQSFTPPGHNAAGDSDWVLVLRGNPLGK